MNGNVCTQIYSNGSFTQVYPMENKTGESIGHTLTKFTDNVGIPDKLVMDLDTAQAGKNTVM
jgi:hypothetical protein